MFAIELKFIDLHLRIFGFTRSITIPGQSVVGYRNTTAPADVHKLRRMTLTSSHGHDESMSTHAWRVLSCPQSLMLYFKTFSPATVLKLLLEHLKMKLLGCFLMSREFPKLAENNNGFFTFFPPFSHSDFLENVSGRN